MDIGRMEVREAGDGAAAGEYEGDKPKSYSWVEVRKAVHDLRKELSSMSSMVPTAISFRKLSNGKTRVYFLTPPHRGCDITLLYTDVNTNISSSTERLEWRPLIESNVALGVTSGRWSREEQLLCERRRVASWGIFSYELHQQSGRVLFPCASSLFVLEEMPDQAQSPPLVPRSLSTGGGAPLTPALCPSRATLAAHAARNDIWLAGDDLRRPARLTYASRGRVERLAEDPLQAGVPCYVTQEEFSRYTGFWWQPVTEDDVYRIVYEEVDESDVKVFSFPSSQTSSGENEEFRFPRAGCPNAKSVLKLVTFRLQRASATTVLDYYHEGTADSLPSNTSDDSMEVTDIRWYELRKPLKDTFPWFEYLARAGWTPCGQFVWVQLLDRKQQRLELALIPLSEFSVETNYDTGPPMSQNLISYHNPKEVQILVTETAPDAWINVHDILYWVSSGPERCSFVWASEETGHQHLYLVTCAVASARPRAECLCEWNRYQVAWSNVHDTLHWVGSGPERCGFVWASEESGHQHLYLVTCAVASARPRAECLCEWNRYQVAWSNVHDNLYRVGSGPERCGFVWASEESGHQHLYLVTCAVASARPRAECLCEWNRYQVAWSNVHDTLHWVGSGPERCGFVWASEESGHQHLYLVTCAVASARPRAECLCEWNRYQVAWSNVHDNLYRVGSGPERCGFVWASEETGHQHLYLVTCAVASARPRAECLCEWNRYQVAWSNVHDTLYWVGSGPERCGFVWASEESGHQHLYLVTCAVASARPRAECLSVPEMIMEDESDAIPANVISKEAITSGEWEVIGKKIWVDRQHGLVYFVGLRETPLERHLYVTSLRARTSPTLLTAAGYSHAVHMDEECTIAVITSSNISVAPQTRVYRVQVGGGAADAPAVALLPLGVITERCAPDSKESRLLNGSQECRSVDGDEDDDTTSIFRRERSLFSAVPAAQIYSTRLSCGLVAYCTLWRAAAAPGCSRRRPTVLHVYGGPEVQTVTNSYKGVRQLRMYMLAARGFNVVAVDSRGSKHRGRAWEAAIKHSMGQIELDDQVEVLQWLAKETGCIDMERVAIHGWSYGGYLSLLGLATRPHIFKVCVAGAPVTCWRLYDTAYTERYMGLPARAAHAYTRASVLKHAPYFPDREGRLLIIHGLADENVHFCHTAALLAELVRLGKPHRVQVYPGERHSLRAMHAAKHYEATLIHFLHENL